MQNHIFEKKIGKFIKTTVYFIVESRRRERRVDFESGELSNLLFFADISEFLAVEGSNFEEAVSFFSKFLVDKFDATAFAVIELVEVDDRNDVFGPVLDNLVPEVLRVQVYNVRQVVVVKAHRGDCA